MHVRPRLVAARLLAPVLANADPESDLRTAEQHAIAGDPHALDELEALGRARPVTAWTDDAWRVAARFAEQRGDFARARGDLAEAIATTDDDTARRRDQADLDRLTSIGGTSGQWDAVAAEHDRLLVALEGPGDPKPALHRLEVLLHDHPDYPRRGVGVLALARGYERDGNRAHAIAVLRGEHEPALVPDLVRMLIRDGKLDEASQRIATIEDAGIARQLRELVESARVRARVRLGVVALLLAIVVLAGVTLRRRASNWRAAARALAKPPSEALFFLPIAVLIVIVAQTGNPLVAAAVRWIAIAGVVVAWVSGVLLTLRRPSRLGLVLHSVLTVTAVLAIVFLAVERDRTLDLVIETWRSGPAPR